MNFRLALVMNICSFHLLWNWEQAWNFQLFCFEVLWHANKHLKMGKHFTENILLQNKRSVINWKKCNKC